MSAPKVLQGISAVIESFSLQGIAKEGENRGQGFKFRSIDQVMNRIGGEFVAGGLVVTQEIRSFTATERENAQGRPMTHVQVGVRYTIHSLDDGSSVTTDCVGEAMDTGDKATSKALSMAYKYFIFQVFAVPVESDDADAESHTIGQRKTKPEAADSEAHSLSIDEADIVSALIKKAEVDLDRFLAAHQITQIKQLTKSQFKRVVEQLQERIKEKADA